MSTLEIRLSTDMETLLTVYHGLMFLMGMYRSINKPLSIAILFMNSPMPWPQPPSAGERNVQEGRLVSNIKLYQSLGLKHP